MTATPPLRLAAARPLIEGAGEAMIVRAAIAPLHSEPRVSSTQISQAVAGHALGVLTREGDWLHVRAGDGYEGWVHSGYLDSAMSVLGRDGAAWFASAALSLGCRVSGTAGERSLPLGALLLPDERCISGESIAVAELERRFPADRAAIVRTALHYFSGTSYQWGGVTPWGADCSGLVQTVLGLHGIPQPRDAWQQAREGAEIEPDATRALPADLLFFSDREDGRITHVGIAAGEGRMVHLALGRGGYAVDTLDEGTAAGDPYVARLRSNLRVARRLPLPV